MNLRRVLRIAKWEAGKGTGGIDRRTAITLAAILAATIPVVLALSGGVPLDQDIYRAGISPDNRYHPVLNDSPAFTLHPPDPATLRNGDIDLLVTDQARYPDTDKGRAALAAFHTAVKNHNTRLMLQEPDQFAAFPLRVNLVYLERDLPETLGTGTGDPGTPDTGTGPETGTGDPDTPADPGESAPGDTTDTGPTGPGGAAAPSVGNALGRDQTGLRSPAAIQPPFPFTALVLAFAFIIPMNFLVQVYGSSIMNERINRRGELLLVSPASRAEIILGKTLPYLAGVMAIEVVTALLLGGSLISIAAVIPIALAFLATSFFGGLVARSFKELTFLMVTVSVGLTTYVFIPAVFTQIHPIAAISPVTMVVHDLLGDPVTLADYAFSTAPLYLVSGVLFALGAAIYREEDLFTQKPVPAKLIDAIQGQLHTRLSVAKLSILFIPFVFATELLAIAALFAAPERLALPLFIALIALTEELFKSIAIYTGLSRGVYPRTVRSALILGTLSGAGFFLGEKITLLATLVGLDTQIRLGRAAFGYTDAPILLLLLAPLLLHTATASISALGARRNRRTYVAALLLAAAIHWTYNMTVVTRLG